MSETNKAYAKAALLCIVVSAVLITYSALSFYDGVTVTTDAMSLDQIGLLEKWME